MSDWKISKNLQNEQTRANLNKKPTFENLRKDKFFNPTNYDAFRNPQENVGYYPNQNVGYVQPNPYNTQPFSYNPNNLNNQGHIHHTQTHQFNPTANNFRVQQNPTMPVVDHTHVIDITQLNTINMEQHRPSYQQPYRQDYFSQDSILDEKDLSQENREKYRTLKYLLENGFISSDEFLIKKKKIFMNEVTPNSERKNSSFKK
ncbi:hypothetical protein [Mycoplasmopsis pulmonis]|nr:hypothetical protein [Mycoplasmopsis pulmonis]VEU67905.1 Uncharacterised protein [Mycoplasmopsis pulmonis]